MRERVLTAPDIALVASTRAALGAGVGLLLANRLNEDHRKGAGWALLIVGFLTTIPLAFKLRSQSNFLRRRAFWERQGRRPEPVVREATLP